MNQGSGKVMSVDDTLMLSLKITSACLNPLLACDLINY